MATGDDTSGGDAPDGDAMLRAAFTNREIHELGVRSMTPVCRVQTTAALLAEFRALTPTLEPALASR